MNNESADSTKQESSLFKRWRKSFLPMQPKDPAPVRLVKHIAFYLFEVMEILISAVDIPAII